MKEMIIKANDANQRLDKFLLKTFPNLSKSMMYKAIRNKKIKVNRKRCDFNQVLNENDSILLFLPEDVLEEKVRKVQTRKPLDIVYEDENLLIVNKPYGLLCQSDTKDAQDCLVSRIQSYLVSTNQYDLHEHSFAPAICNRLDRNTTGLIIAAKNAQSLRIVNEAIQNHKIHKYYKALVSGELKESGNITLYLKKDGTKALISNKEKEGYKKSELNYSILENRGNETWVDIELKTGRFHQIRASFSSIGHPLVADTKYGYKGKKKRIDLQAYKLVFENIDLQLNQNVFEIH